MRQILFIAAAISAFIAPAQAEPNLERGLAGALRGCEEWVLNPASWSGGTGPFVSIVGLGSQMGRVDHVEDVNLPPKQFRGGNHYWRINTTQDAGYVLVVSDQLPMCHITGGGNTDIQPSVETVIASAEFAKRWQKTADLSKGEMATTQFQNRVDPALSMVISRAKRPGERLDRVQLIATATYKLDE